MKPCPPLKKKLKINNKSRRLVIFSFIIVNQLTSHIAFAVDYKPINQEIANLEQQHQYYINNGVQRVANAQHLLDLAQLEKDENWYWSLGARDLRTSIFNPLTLTGIGVTALAPAAGTVYGSAVGSLGGALVGGSTAAISASIPAVVITKGLTLAARGTNWVAARAGVSPELIDPENVAPVALSFTFLAPTICGALAGGIVGSPLGACMGGVVGSTLVAPSAVLTACTFANYKPISDAIKYVLKKSGAEPDYDKFHAEAVRNYSENLESEKAGYRKFQDDHKQLHQRILTRNKVAKAVIQYIISPTVGAGEKDPLASFPILDPAPAPAR